MSPTSPQSDRRWPHRLAIAVAMTTFPVIWMGGLVTTYEAGMAVPDWPSTYGYNLFLYPWQTWLLGPWDLFIEHGHRLLAASVGLLTILLMVTLWRSSSGAMRWLGVVALAGVLFQGVLGGMRVRMDERLLARIHGCGGPAFFAYIVALCVLTSRGWRSDASAVQLAGGGSIQRLALSTTVLAYLQIVIGAHLRHQSLAASPVVFKIVVMFHLFLAAAIALHVAMLAAKACRLPAKLAALSRPTWALAVLLLMQIGLGISTWVENYGWPAGTESYAIAAGHTVYAQSQLQGMITTAHVAVGSLILATSLVVTLSAFRWLRVPSHSSLPVGGNLARLPSGRDNSGVLCGSAAL